MKAAVSINDIYARACNGDSAAEAELFEHLYVSFRLFARLRQWDSAEAEDVIQGAILKILQSYQRTRIRSSFASWAHTILGNEFIDFCRGKAAYQRKLSELAMRHRVPAQSREDPTLKSRLKDCLRRLHETRPLHARVVNLHYQGYTTAEISDKLQITANYLNVVLYRARSMLRAYLKEGGTHHD